MYRLCILFISLTNPDISVKSSLRPNIYHEEAGGLKIHQLRGLDALLGLFSKTAEILP